MGDTESNSATNVYKLAEKHVAASFRLAVKNVDNCFGGGYACNHPELIDTYMKYHIKHLSFNMEIQKYLDEINK